jgi:hypothetical protein
MLTAYETTLYLEHISRKTYSYYILFRFKTHIKQKPTKCFKTKNIFQWMHNRLPRILSLDWHTRWRLHPKVQIASVIVRVQHLAATIPWCAELFVWAKLGTLPLQVSFITLLINNSRFLPLLWQFFLILSRIIKFVLPLWSSNQPQTNKKINWGQSFGHRARRRSLLC